MKAPISGSIVLLGACGTLEKSPHAGALPVVRQRLDHCEAGTTVGAGQERIAIPPIGRVEELGLASWTDRGIGGDRLAAVGLVRAPHDREAIEAAGDGSLGCHSLDSGEWGCLLPQLSQEVLELGSIPLNLDLDLAGGVAHPTGQPMPERQPVNERAEADSLDHPGHLEAQGRA
jgi:hypothetical protein